MVVEKKQKELDVVEKELNDAVVTFQDPSYSNVCNREAEQQPVISMLIPNKLLRLFETKIDLMKRLTLSIP